MSSPHPPEVITRIRRLVEQDYPATQYKYQIEVAIPDTESLLGTQMFPDILVWDLYGNLVCVAEIGRAYPEKLIAYHDDLKIPDVRWYDFSGWYIPIHHQELNIDRYVKKLVEAMDGKAPAEREQVAAQVCEALEIGVELIDLEQLESAA
jgi:hypothetical protein